MRLMRLAAKTQHRGMQTRSARAAGDDNVRQSALDGPLGLEQRRQAGHLALRQRVVRSAGVVRDANMASRHIRQILQQPERKELGQRDRAPTTEFETSFDQTALIGRAHLFQIGVNQLRPEDHAQPLRRDAPGLESRVGIGQIRRGEAKLNVARHHLEAFAGPDEGLGIEVADFGADLDGQSAGVERFQSPDSAPAIEQRVPELGVANSNRADDAHPRNHDFSDRSHAGNRNPVDRNGGDLMLPSV